jgi:hypothetical protein
MVFTRKQKFCVLFEAFDTARVAGASLVGQLED